MSDTLYRTYPDYGVSPNQLPSPEVDIAELAARLGSPSAFRRRGRVIFMDTFDTGLNGWYIVSGSAGIYYGDNLNSSAIPWRGDGCTKLIPNFNNICIIRKWLPYLPTTRIGVEVFLMAAKLVGAPDFINISADVGNGVTTQEFSIRIDVPNKEIELWTTGPAWVVVGTFLAPLEYRAWHNLKFVFDVQLGKYTVIEYDTQRIDVSAYSSVVTSASDGISLDLQVTHSGGVNPVFFDDLIVTIDEA